MMQGLLAARRRQLSGTPATIALTAQATSTSDLTTYTFSSQALGDAAADRYVAVAVAARSGPTGTISSVTIGGQSATQAVTVGSSAQTGDIWIAAVPSGTTGDVVVTFSTGQARCTIAVYRLTGIGGVTPDDTDTDTVAAGNVMQLDALSVPANGVAIALVASNTASSISWTWTGLTEDTDTGDIEGGWGSSAASDAFGSAQADLDPTAEMNTTPSGPVMVGASWAPA